MDRRQFLALGAAVGTAGLAGCTFSGATESNKHAGTEIALDPVIEGLSFPTTMAFLPDGGSLIAERSGLVRRHDGEELVDQPFLDVREDMAEVSAEKGLLGLALHPDFPERSEVYVRYSGQRREWVPERMSHTAVLTSFEVTDDRTGVVPDSERRILEVAEPGPVHNAGDIAFGPDGYLYVTLGDGQRTDIGDNGWSWWYDQGQAAQNTEDNLLGGVLRLDVDGDPTEHPRSDPDAPAEPEGEEGYAVPSDNPLVGEPGRNEYYAWGLRNPYRLSFDNGRLFVGNVGEHTRESIYLLEKGANCGWPILEGSSCAPTTSIGHAVSKNPLNALNPKTWLAQTNRISPVRVCPTPDRADDDFLDPIVEYRRPGSRSVTGGYVYRGDEIPELQGQYVFGDFILPAPIFALDNPGEGERPQSLTELVVSGTKNGRLNEGLVSFARDFAGEMYVLSTDFTEGGGRVRRLTSA